MQIIISVRQKAILLDMSRVIFFAIRFLSFDYLNGAS